MDLSAMLEHDYEPTPGLPEALPRNEKLLWQGASEFKSLAARTFHVRKLAAYFVALLLLRLVLELGSGTALVSALASSVGLTFLAAAAIGVLLLYSWLIARSTLFTITNNRIIIRAGVAVPMTVNLPFSRIVAADLRVHADGSGDIAILTEAKSRVSYVLLWPYVKPWRFMRVRPVLRGVANAKDVASLLADALASSSPPGTSEAKDAKQEAASSDTTKAAGKRTRRRNWLAYPTFPLASAASLVVIALLAVAILQISGGSTEAPQAPRNIVAEVQLLFKDRDDGAVIVVDALSGDTIDILEPGTNGFLRSTMRTFVRERKAVAVGNEAPFALQQTQSGRLILSDRATGREVDLWAFGKTNAEAFRRFLLPHSSQSVATNADSPTTQLPPGETAVAHTIQETTQ